MLTSKCQVVFLHSRSYTLCCSAWCHSQDSETKTLVEANGDVTCQKVLLIIINGSKDDYQARCLKIGEERIEELGTCIKRQRLLSPR